MEYKTALAINPGDATVHSNLGNVCTKKGLFDKAIEEYNIAIQLDPNNFNAHYALGSLYQGIGLTDKAIEAFQKNSLPESQYDTWL